MRQAQLTHLQCWREGGLMHGCACLPCGTSGTLPGQHGTCAGNYAGLTKGEDCTVPHSQSECTPLLHSTYSLLSITPWNQQQSFLALRGDARYWTWDSCMQINCSATGTTVHGCVHIYTFSPWSIDSFSSNICTSSGRRSLTPDIVPPTPVPPHCELPLFICPVTPLIHPSPHWQSQRWDQTKNSPN